MTHADVYRAIAARLIGTTKSARTVAESMNFDWRESDTDLMCAVAGAKECAICMVWYYSDVKHEHVAAHRKLGT